MTIEQNVAKVYRIRHQNNENRQEYLDRVVTKINDTSDDDWERLTEEAQEWFNRAIAPWKTREVIPDYPDAEEQEDTTETDQSDLPHGEEEAVSTKKAAKKKSAVGKKKVVASAKSRRTSDVVKKKKKVSSNGKVVASRPRDGKLAASGESCVKRAMLKNMRATPAELNKALKKEGRELSPVRLSIIKAGFRHSIRLLQEEGKLKDKYIV